MANKIAKKIYMDGEPVFFSGSEDVVHQLGIITVDINTIGENGLPDVTESIGWVNDDCPTTNKPFPYFSLTTKKVAESTFEQTAVNHDGGVKTRVFVNGQWNAWSDTDGEVKTATLSVASGSTWSNSGIITKSGNTARMCAYITGMDITANKVIATIPDGFRPKSSTKFLTIYNGTNHAVFSMEPDGSVTGGAFTSANLTSAILSATWLC